MKTSGPPSVTEWDLARAAIVRTLTLPVPTDEFLPLILRVGDQLRVLVSGLQGITGTQGLAFVQLTRDLRIECIKRWIGAVDPQGIQAFSADPTLTAVSYFGNAATVARGDAGTILMSFDASGKRIASRLVQREDDENRGLVEAEPNAAVVDGHVFVLLGASPTGVELVAFTSDLRIEKRVLLRPEEEAMTLRARGGRLQIAGFNPGSVPVEFSTNLERLGPPAPHEDSADFKLGDETVCVRNERGRAWLAWTTSSADPCAFFPEFLPPEPPPRPGKP
jgi:hypothetical protein